MLKKYVQYIPLDIASVESECLGGSRERRKGGDVYKMAHESVASWQEYYALARILVPGLRGALRVLMLLCDTFGAELGRGRAANAPVALRRTAKEELEENRISIVRWGV